MKGNEQIVVNFNRLLTNELAVANQYFLHASIYKHWGFNRLYNIGRQDFLDEIQHAELYIQRILFLEGLPNIKYNGLCIDDDSKDVEEILRLDLDLEYNAVNSLRECISYADSLHDFVSRDIMTKILIDEEAHINFLETEISLISQIGIHNYLQHNIDCVMK